MPRIPYLIQDSDGGRVGVLVSIREQWRLRDTLVLEGRRYRVEAIVPFEAGDISGCAAVLVVERTV